MRDPTMGLQYGPPSPNDVCAWCGEALAARRVVASTKGPDPLAFCSAACAAARREHIARMEVWRMSHVTTCTKCGRAYQESSEERANVPAWVSDRLCHECHAFEVRDARIRGELDAGRLPDPADFVAQVEHIERQNAAIADDLAATLREYDDDGEALAGDLEAIAERLEGRDE